VINKWDIIVVDDSELLIRDSSGFIVHRRTLVAVRVELFKGLDALVLRCRKKFLEILDLGTRFLIRVKVAHNCANVSVGLDVVGEAGVRDFEFSVLLLDLEDVAGGRGRLHAGHFYYEKFMA
tara:strand:+ start:198 stop:563 length:366 start_codon:yes stop_codon:yes gene_type:complete